MDKPTREIIQEALTGAPGQPARDIYELLLRIDTTLGLGNDGMLDIYIKEVQEALIKIGGFPILNFDGIVAELLKLTQMHEKYLEQHDTLNRLFNSDVVVTGEDLDKAVAELEQKVPGFRVWFEPRHKRYVLVPQLKTRGKKE